MAIEEQGLEKRNRVELFGSGGREHREIYGQGVSAEVGAIAEDDFAEDDGMAQAAFRNIVGRRHAMDAQERKEAVGVALGIEQTLAEVLRLRVINGRVAPRVACSLRMRRMWSFTALSSHQSSGSVLDN